MQLEAVCGDQGDVAEFEFGFFRGERLAGLGVEQQRVTTAEGQKQEEDAEDSHPVKPQCG